MFVLLVCIGMSSFILVVSHLLCFLDVFTSCPCFSRPFCLMIFHFSSHCWFGPWLSIRVLPPDISQSSTKSKQFHIRLLAQIWKGCFNESAFNTTVSDTVKEKLTIIVTMEKPACHPHLALPLDVNAQTESERIQRRTRSHSGFLSEQKSRSKTVQSWLPHVCV